MSVNLYRNRVTGLIGETDDTVASVFPDVLELVDADAKPLAFVPISQEAIDALRAEADAENAARDAANDPALKVK